VESGQIQLGNHTFSHPDLVGLPKDQVAKELQRNHQFLMGTYGVDGRRYYRPPYGSHNPSSTPSQPNSATRFRRCAPARWGTRTSYPKAKSSRWRRTTSTPQAIVIGHLNHLPVTHVYDQLVEVILSRKLRTITLDDVFATPELQRLGRPVRHLISHISHLKNIRRLRGVPSSVCRTMGI